MIYGDELAKVQEIELSIFKSVIELCDDNNIEYFILGGTLLGAVRHQGFIPWDDDIDIGMTRENYNKFIDIAIEELPDDLFFQIYATEKSTPFYFAKIRKNGTKFIENYCKELNINHGLFLDIFPFDNIPDDIRLRKKQLRKVKFWSNMFIAKTLRGSSIPQDSFEGKVKIFIRSFFHFFLKLCPKKFLYNKLDNVSQQYNNITCEMKSFVKYPFLMIPSDDLNKFEQIEFEGIQVNCPRNPQKQLKHHFGDFMKLPPEEEKVGHRPYKLEL